MTLPCMQILKTPEFVIALDAEGVLYAPAVRPDDWRRMTTRRLDGFLTREWREASFEPTAVPVEETKPTP